MSGFYYRGKRSEDFGLTLLKHRIHSPDLREYEEEVAGRHGVIDYGTELGKRTIELDVLLQGDDPLDIMVSKVAAWLNPMLPAGELKIDAIPGRMFKAKYTGKLGIERLGKAGTITITMKCTDPFYYSDEKTTETTLTSSPSSVTIVSEGDIETPPVITLTNNGGNTIHGFILTNEYEVE